MFTMPTRLSRLVCLAIDHRPQVTEDVRSGNRLLLCARCNRFLGVAHAPMRRMPDGLAAAARLIAKVETKSAH